MSEETGLATRDSIAALIAGETSNKFATEDALVAVTKVGNYLPFLAVYGSNSTEVKEGKFPMGHLGLRASRNNIIDLGTETPVLVLAWRPKAMQYRPKVLSFFDPEDSRFKAIQATADQKNSGKGYGPEFLVWLPTVQKFAAYFLGNKTGRNEAPNLLGPLKDGPFVTLQRCHLIDDGQNKWHGAETAPYDLDIEMPTNEALLKELQAFNNPDAAQEELSESDDSGEAR